MRSYFIAGAVVTVASPAPATCPAGAGEAAERFCRSSIASDAPRVFGLDAETTCRAETISLREDALEITLR